MDALLVVGVVIVVVVVVVVLVSAVVQFSGMGVFLIVVDKVVGAAVTVVVEEVVGDAVDTFCSLAGGLALLSLLPLPLVETVVAVATVVVLLPFLVAVVTEALSGTTTGVGEFLARVVLLTVPTAC